MSIATKLMDAAQPQAAKKCSMPSLMVNGVRLHCKSSGTGEPAFVFVHGGLCDHRDWVNQAESLSHAGYTVVTPDMRGHGCSEGAIADCRIGQWAADLNALIDELQLSRVVLTGHSLASRVVAEAAWRRPDNVSALVLLDGSCMYNNFASFKPRASDCGSGPLDRSLTDIFNLTIGPYANHAMRTAILDTMSSASRELMQATVAGMKEWDMDRAEIVFRTLSPALPILAIQSTYHDQVVPRHSLARNTKTTPYLDFIRSKRSDVAVTILPDTGHFSMLEKADQVTSLIKDFGLAAAAIRKP